MSKPVLIPLSKVYEGEAKNILKGVGLALITPKLFTLSSEKLSVEAGTYEQITETGYDKIGMYGLPVWDTVTLQTDAYINDKGETVPITKLELEIALVEINNNRNIVKTSVAGRNGTIKEYMSDGDDAVTIRGSLTTKYSNLPPYDLINKYKFITRSPLALTVLSNFINYMGIYNLVIEDAKIKQREGMRNVYDYEISCSSDIPSILETNA